MRLKGVILCVLCMILSVGCSVQKVTADNTEERSYETVMEEDIPEEMKDPIQERKDEPFLLTYADQGWLYIAKGYGKQETDGYEIQVESFGESENAIVLKTIFLGPEPDEKIQEVPTFPYVVIRTKYSNKYVMAE